MTSAADTAPAPGAPRAVAKAGASKPAAPAKKCAAPYLVGTCIIRCWPHLRRMLERRGLDVGASMPERVGWDYVCGPLADEEFHMRVRATQPGALDTVVVFTNVVKVGIPLLRAEVQAMQEHGAVANVIALSVQGSTSPVAKLVASYRWPCTVSVMAYHTLFYTVVDHELIRDHRVISSSRERRAVRSAYHRELSAFPRILSGDPVVRYHDAKRGSLVETTMRTGDEEPTKYYRVVT